MKGIVLAGGTGSRLYPLTCTVSKQLLPVYDKPVIYYPLSILMLSGIKEILIISTPRDTPHIEALLGDGSDYGLKLSYKTQESPKGIAEAFLIGKEFIGNDSVCLILGDNLFFGQELALTLEETCANFKKGSVSFAYRVSDPERYGVVEFSSEGNAIHIEEKPKKPKSNWAITGIYIFDSRVSEITSKQKPSARGELEITSILENYLEKGELKIEKLGRGVAWLDMGTPDSLLGAGHFVQTIEKRQGLKIACLEEIAFQKKFIDEKKLLTLAERFKNSEYGAYLKRVLDLQNE